MDYNQLIKNKHADMREKSLTLLYKRNVCFPGQKVNWVATE